ncbi:hypothetical protein GW17_00026052 [Ensete ventricosum]|nr:hypothetical protein GW17_00026052 [Ensete ventricosum]
MAGRPRRVLSDRGRKAESEQRTNPNLQKKRRRRHGRRPSPETVGDGIGEGERESGPFHRYGCELGGYDPNCPARLSAAISVTSVKSMHRVDVVGNSLGVRGELTEGFGSLPGWRKEVR